MVVTHKTRMKQPAKKRLPHTLSRKLMLVIALKILFLTVFWQLVLKHQVAHVTSSLMGNRLVAPEPQGN